MVVKTPVCSACEGQRCGLLASVIKQHLITAGTGHGHYQPHSDVSLSVLFTYLFLLSSVQESKNY